MTRYISILEGMSVNDIEQGGANDYFGYTHSDGSWVIMRQDSAGVTIKYAVGKDNYPTAWSGRTSLIYKRSYEWNY